MSLKKTAWDAVKYILENNATLSAYVEEIFEGDRENIMQHQYPCIIMEDGGEEEIPRALGGHKLTTFRIGLILGMNITRNAQSITGVVGEKGILDFSDDVRNALDTYIKLDYDGTPRCVYFDFPEVAVGDITQTYPFRFRRITMAIRLASTPASR